MGAFSNSWQITKSSYQVIKQDKELLLFPLLSGIFSILLIIAMLFPTVVIPVIMGEDAESLGFLQYVYLFLTYFGLSFIATFFNTCIVYTVKKRFEGANATFGESIKFAFSRIRLIFVWSLISATVGIILRLIERISERFGIFGQIITRIITSIVGMLWSIATVFVIPGMVYKNLGPIDAIKNSISSLKKTWGEGLIGFIGIGLIQMLLIVAGIVFAVFAFIAASAAGFFAVIALAALLIIYFVFVILFFSVLESVFKTALYVYSQTGKIPSGFSAQIMNDAFKKKKVS